MKSTLTILVALTLLCLFAPEAAWAGKGKKRPNMCSDPIVRAMNSSACDSGPSRSSSASMRIGWSCRTKGDEYDQYRRVQNKSSRKNTETFLTNSSMGMVSPVASTVLSGASPLSIISLLQTAFSFGNNSDNLTVQQKLACDRLELQIAEIKRNRAAIAKIGTDTKDQVQQVATNLGKQIPTEVQKQVASEVDKQVAARMKTEREAIKKEVFEEMKKEGAVFMEPGPENAAPEPAPQVNPEEKPATSQENPAPPSGANAPSVSAPTPPKEITPTIINEVAKPEPEINFVSQKIKAMIGW